MERLASERAELAGVTAGTDYVASLDGLRFLSCSAVVVAHSLPFGGPISRLGGFGVDIFFALSGFLITRLLLLELSRTGTVSLRRFYLRRTLRIWPVYFAALVAFFGLLAVRGDRILPVFGFSGSADAVRGLYPAYLAFVSNWSTREVPTPLSILWSVSVEEQFYVLFPLCFAFSKRRNPVFRVVGVGLLVAWVVRCTLAGPNALERISYNTFAHGDHLLLGALLAQFSLAYPVFVRRSCERAGAVGEIALIVAAAAWLALENSRLESAPSWWLYFLASALICGSAVAVVGFGRGPIARILGSRVPRELGKLTYPAYVFHPYSIALGWGIAERVFPGRVVPAAALRVSIALVSAFVVAFVVHVTFEDRARKLGQTRRAKE